MLDTLEVTGVGEQGLVADAPQGELPPAAWTALQNIRVKDGKLQSFAGHDLGGENTAASDIWGLFPVSSVTSHFWVHVVDTVTPGTTKVYAFDGTTFHDVSPTVALTSAREDIVTGCFLNQRLVVNNQEDQPHTWDLNTSNPMTIIPGWDSDWRAKVMLAFKGFLIALAITDTGVFRPSRVKWSAEAAPGSLPSSWDETDPTIAAGEVDLGDTTAELQTGAVLRDEVMLYTQNEIRAMSFIGGDNVWRFRKVSDQAGSLTSRGVSTFRGQHVVLTDQDVVLTDGQSVQSIIDQRNRSFLFNQLSAANFGFAFVQTHRARSEVWVCFPTGDRNYCDLALVWNWNQNTWGVRELPEGCIAAANGLDIVGLQTLLWSGASQTWAQASRAWDERTYNTAGGLLLLTGDNSPAGLTGAPIFRAEEGGSTFNGTAKTARAERLGLRIQGDRSVTVREVWPRMTGGLVNVRVGYQNVPNGPVTWRVNKAFDPEVDRKVTCRVSGKYPCIAFESMTDSSWALQGYALKYRKDGARR